MTLVKDCSSWLHFKWYNFYNWLSFIVQLPYHLIFHEQEYGWTAKGYIICSCDYVVDTGVTYGMHCDKCWNRLTRKTGEIQK